MSADGPYKCVSCNGKEFKSREELEKHNEEQHMNKVLFDSELPLIPPKRTFTC